MSGRRLVAPRPRTPWYDSPWRVVGTAFSAAATVAVVALIVALVVVPRLVGGASLTVLTGSMEPSLSPGDVVVTRGMSADEVCTDVPVGSIVTFLPKPDDPALITHRVVGKTIGTFDDGTRCRLVTQGDANSAVDDPVSPAQVRGVFLYGLPKLGWAQQWATGNTQGLMIVGALALVAYGIWTSRRPKSSVMVLPGTGQPAPPVPTTQPAPGDAREQELRERELAVRERELALREHELALRAGRPARPTGPAGQLAGPAGQPSNPAGSTGQPAGPAGQPAGPAGQPSNSAGPSGPPITTTPAMNEA